jgi:hypothetical protein
MTNEHGIDPRVYRDEWVAMKLHAHAMERQDTAETRKGDTPTHVHELTIIDDVGLAHFAGTITAVVARVGERRITRMVRYHESTYFDTICSCGTVEQVHRSTWEAAKTTHCAKCSAELKRKHRRILGTPESFARRVDNAHAARQHNSKRRTMPFREMT